MLFNMVKLAVYIFNFLLHLLKPFPPDKIFHSSSQNMGYRYINTEYLEMVTGSDKSITEEIIGIFRQQIVEFGDKMKSLYESRSYAELGQLAHKAKSSVAIMGMENLAGKIGRAHV